MRKAVYIYSMPAIPNVPMPKSTSPKGRGTGWALAHRYERDRREPFDDGWVSVDEPSDGGPPPVPTRVIEQNARTVLAANDSPDIGFDLAINPYRGCEHGCIYCYARPSHAYLDLSPGVDFETRIVAKVNAAERLRATFSSPSYVPRPLNLGSATDVYQPVERQLRITRAVIEVLSEFGHPFTLFTKSSGIERDLDLIAPMAGRRLVAIDVSLTTLDAGLARIMEPRAASPDRRLRTIRTLADAGVPVGVSVSPVIPFINEPEIERILEAARDAGATRACHVVLRLPWEVRPLFRQWLAQHFPDRAERVMARLREMRGGRDNDSRFVTRMTGEGVWAELLHRRFEVAARRLGLDRPRPELDFSQFRRIVGAAEPRQASLF